MDKNALMLIGDVNKLFKCRIRKKAEENNNFEQKTMIAHPRK